MLRLNILCQVVCGRIKAVFAKFIFYCVSYIFCGISVGVCD